MHDSVISIGILSISAMFTAYMQASSGVNEPDEILVNPDTFSHFMEEMQFKLRPDDRNHFRVYRRFLNAVARPSALVPKGEIWFTNTKYPLDRLLNAVLVVQEWL